MSADSSNNNNNNNNNDNNNNDKKRRKKRCKCGDDDDNEEFRYPIPETLNDFRGLIEYSAHMELSTGTRTAISDHNNIWGFSYVRYCPTHKILVGCPHTKYGNPNKNINITRKHEHAYDFYLFNKNQNHRIHDTSLFASYVLPLTMDEAIENAKTMQFTESDPHCDICQNNYVEGAKIIEIDGHCTVVSFDHKLTLQIICRPISFGKGKFDIVQFRIAIPDNIWKSYIEHFL